jgi:alpha-methylacyl-CoA racemase
VTKSTGPLAGTKILEFVGIGPGPFAGMMLADMGADVLAVQRPGIQGSSPGLADMRGKRIIELDLKQPDAVATCLRLAERADIVFEGNRPGVMERLSLGPDDMLGRNPRLVYGRMTGWGQHGPLANAAGHDINYIALTGALHAIGTAGKPVPPLNLTGDYGGGSMFLVVGLLAALLHVRGGGKGQVVDAAMTDGAGYLMSLFYALHALGQWRDERSANLLDGGAPFYDTYQCSDGKWVALGAIEPQFYALLLEKTDSAKRLPRSNMDEQAWSAMQDDLRAIFAAKSRDEWCAILEGTDVCFAPVLSLAEAPNHPHNVARNAFVNVNGIIQPAPAPRFSETPSKVNTQPAKVTVETSLRAWGLLPETAP